MDRRSVLKAAAALSIADSLLARAAAPNPSSAVLSIQQNYSPGLDRPEIYAFLVDPNQPTWTDAFPTRQGYSRPPTSSKLNGPPTVVPLIWAIRDYYDVIDLSTGPTGQVVGH